MKTILPTLRGRWAILLFIVLVAVAITALLPPIPQPQSYHQFGDARTMFGIPRALDVLSNLPFAAVGLLGLFAALRNLRVQAPRAQQLAWLTLFAGLLLTGLGSGYYHLAPDNQRLVWDRLPMTLAMSGFLSLLLLNRVHSRIGWVLPALLALGVATVLQWNWSEANGRGDLRWYLLFQGLVMLSGVLLLIMFPAIRNEPTRALVIAVCANIAAKLFELLDAPIFATGGIVSGHTLKHLSAGLGFIPALLWLWKQSSLAVKSSGYVPAQF
jgi:hypothetical protein